MVFQAFLSKKAWKTYKSNRLLDEFGCFEVVYPSDIYIIIVNGDEITVGDNNTYTVGIDNFASLEITATMVGTIANEYYTAFLDNKLDAKKIIRLAYVQSFRSQLREFDKGNAGEPPFSA